MIVVLNLQWNLYTGLWISIEFSIESPPSEGNVGMAMPTFPSEGGDSIGD
jgi:hypothetical protein